MHLRVTQPIETAPANYVGSVMRLGFAHDPDSWVKAGGAHLDGPMNLCGEEGDGSTDPHHVKCGRCLMAIEQLIPLGLLGIGRTRDGEECISSLMHAAFPWAPALLTYRHTISYDVGYDNQPEVETELVATYALEYAPSVEHFDSFDRLAAAFVREVGNSAGSFLLTDVDPD